MGGSLFFSDLAEKFRREVRASAPATEWLVFAVELATFGLELLDQIEIAVGDGRRFVAAALFKRAPESFQSAMMLAERGAIAAGALTMALFAWQERHGASSMPET